MSIVNQAKRRTGLDPLAYLGTEPVTPAQFVALNEDPTTNDYYNFNLGAVWLNTLTQDVWFLVKLANRVATWVKFIGSTGDVIKIVTDSGTAIPATGIIDLLAQPQAGSSVVFSASSNIIKLNVTDASNNTIIGLNGGNNSLTGTGNTGFGEGVLGSTTTANANNAFGTNSLNKATTGGANSAFGTSTLANLTSGTNNSVFGWASGITMTTGASNSLYGSNAGQFITTGVSNTSMGYGSLVTGLAGLTTGSYNTALGVGAGGAYTSSESSNICIGNAGINGESHQIHIGTQGTGIAQTDIANIHVRALIVPDGVFTVNNNGDTASPTGVISLNQTSNDSVAGFIQITKQHGAGNAIVSGDPSGYFAMYGYDGTNYVQTAKVASITSGTVAANRVAGDLEFSTHPDSASGLSATQRMVISSAGNVTINAPDSGIALTSPTTYQQAGLGATTALAIVDSAGKFGTNGSFVDWTSWTPTIIGETTAGTTTYTSQTGRYTRIGNTVIATFSVLWTASTGTGNLNIASLPYTSINVLGLYWMGAVFFQSTGFAWPMGTTSLSAEMFGNKAFLRVACSGTGVSPANPYLQMDNATASIRGTIVYTGQ